MYQTAYEKPRMLYTWLNFCQTDMHWRAIGQWVKHLAVRHHRYRFIFWWLPGEHVSRGRGGISILSSWDSNCFWICGSNPILEASSNEALFLKTRIVLLISQASKIWNQWEKTKFWGYALNFLCALNRSSSFAPTSISFTYTIWRFAYSVNNAPSVNVSDTLRKWVIWVKA